MKKSFLNLVTLVALSLFVVACGSQHQVLTNVSVQTKAVEEDIMVDFNADLNLGSMTFPAVSLPILHPRGQTPIGKVDLVPALGGKNQLKVSLNVSELADIQAARAVLPNGNPIPLIANNETIAVNLGAGAKLYFIISDTAVALGVAVPIKSFDNIGNRLPGLNIFPVRAFGKVIATAGLFTSANAGQNGIAVVADLSQVVKFNSSSSVSRFAQAEQNVIRLDYSSQEADAASKQKVDSMLYDMSNKKTKLQLHR